MMDRLQKFGRYSMRMMNRLTKRGEEEDADYNFTSTVNEETRVISWTIENINSCLLEAGQYYESPPFCTGFSSEIKWALRLYPKGREVAGKVGIFIHSISEPLRNDASLKFVLQVKLISDSDEDSKGKDEIYTYRQPALTDTSSEEIYHAFFGEGKPEPTDDKKEKSRLREVGTDEFIPSRCLFGKKALLIKCHLHVSCLDRESESSITGLRISSTLYDDLKAMHKSGRFSDVTLQVGKKVFPAHKAILAARSKVFAAMFDHETKEKLTNEIIIEDVEPSVMNTVLQYIYTGKVETMTMDGAASIFSVADKYSLEELQKWCVGIMLEKLSVENVCQVAVLADMHSVPKLKTATNYLFRKYMHEIVGKKEWKRIIREKPQLASEILQAVSSDFNTNAKRF